MLSFEKDNKIDKTRKENDGRISGLSDQEDENR